MVARIALIGKSCIANKTQRCLENNNPDAFFLLQRLEGLIMKKENSMNHRSRSRIELGDYWDL